ncbi:MAG: glycoside hydrolase family 2 TIM barrel-domain containing protein [Verrucomicrobiota bacterium]|jgi:beta-galactosidase
MLNRSTFASCLVALNLTAALCLAPAALAAAESAAGPREIIPFDTGWRFHLGDDPAARQPGFDDANWRAVDVPHDWSIEGPLTRPPEGQGEGGFFTHGIGWYRKSFTLPASVGKKVVIEFDGVYMNSEVWINGQFLGRRPYGFVGFRYDLSDFLKTNGSPNVLAVRVDDSLEPSVRWYAGSGIYRHVRLITTGYTGFRLDGGITVTTPEITPDEATVEVNAIIDANFFTEAERAAWRRSTSGASPTNREVVLRSSVLGPDGAVVAGAESKLTLQVMRPGQRATQRITVPKPRLWSESTPVLYRLRGTLELDGAALDETTTTFGIRSLKFDPDRGLLVNGKPTKLKGVCVHQDAASFGNAAPAAVWALRLAELKEMGCNAIRTSHHPFAPEFYDLCDQMGFYVFDEAFDEWTRSWLYNDTENPQGKSQYGYHLYFDQWHATDIRAMLRRDRNHPCVVLWSIGNEIPNQLDADGFKLARELVAICHEEDPTRPATSACDQSAVASRNGFMDELDIGGYNYIDRLYGANTYAPERARFPRRLILGTETGSQIHYWLGVRDHDYVIGEFIWTGIDYLGETSFPRRGNGSGFLDIAAGKKAGFYQRAAYWRDDPVLQILIVPAAGASARDGGAGRAGRGGRGGRGGPPPPTLANWNGTAGAQMTVRAVANCDEVELFLNDSSLGRHAIPPDAYFSDWTVPYAPGTLSAVGYRAGKQVAAQKLTAAGAPVRLKITPLPSPISNECALYEITVVDDAGVTVLDAAPAVTVRVEGPGRLIGLDTGDLSYGGLFKTDTRDAYQGRLLATVQLTPPAGVVTFRGVRVSATAPGLAPAQTGGNP